MSKKQNVRKIGDKPRQLDLHGDPAIAMEKAENIITFPGGYIAVMRTSDNEYWVHLGFTSPSVYHPVEDGHQDTLGAIKALRVHTDREGVPFGLAALIGTAKPDDEEDYLDMGALAEKYAQIAGKVGLRPKLDNINHQ